MKGQQDKIEKALKRVEGQVRGIGKMYAEDKACLEIAQQIAASKEALSRVGRELLKTEACKCMADEKEKQKVDINLKQLFKS